MTTLVKPRICFVCSHGGHLNELLDLLPAFEGYDHYFIAYLAPTTIGLHPALLLPNMARNPIEFLKNLVRIRRVFREWRPHMIVSTGAEIAIPAVIIGKLFCRSRVIYVECGAQVETPSVTGRVMAYLADSLYVQWPELLPAYRGRAKYAGSLTAEDLPA